MKGVIELFCTFTSLRVVNFVSYESEVSMYGTAYDYGSITHYAENAFSRNGSATIVAKQPSGKKLMVKLSLKSCF